MGPQTLPVELVTLIAQNLPVRDISRFAQSCRGIYTVLDPILYRRVRDDVDIVAWAVEQGKTGMVAKLLAAGADPNTAPACRKRERGYVNGHLAHHSADYQMQLMLLEQQNLRRQGLLFPRGWLSPLSDTWTPLHVAASLGLDDIINLLLEHGANVNALSRGFCECKYPNDTHSAAGMPWWMPLHTAICHGNRHSARLLMAWGASFQVATRPEGSLSAYATALHTASCMGDIETSIFTLDHYKPSIEVKDHQGASPVVWAYRAGQAAMVEWLIRKGANVDAAFGPGYTLLMDACASRRFEDASRLIELGADVQLPGLPKGNTLLHQVCGSPYTESGIFVGDAERASSLAASLIHAGADVNARNADGVTPLDMAAARGIFPLVQLLLGSGAVTESPCPQVRTPLMMACSLAFNGSGSLLETAKLLLDHGALANKICYTDEGGTALDILCNSRRDYPHKLELVQLLLACGSPINSNDHPLTSVIFPLFLDDELEICKLLQQRGAKPPCRSQLPPMLAHAIKSNDAAALRFALQFKDANKVLATKARLFNALRSNRANVAEMILDAGAPWSYVAKTGWTCLLHACEHGNLTVVRKLLAAGADPNRSFGEGLTALHLAIRKENIPILEALLDYGGKIHLVPTVDPDPGRKEAPGSALRMAISTRKPGLVECMLRPGMWGEAAPAQRVEYMAIICDLHSRQGNDSDAILDVLLRAGADPNTPLRCGCYLPLQIFIMQRNKPPIEVLLKHGADVHIQPSRRLVKADKYFERAFGDDRPTPLETALVGTVPSDRIVEMLLAYRPFVNRPPELMVSYIRLLCNNYFHYCFQAFFAAGISPNIQDEKGNNALSLMFNAIERTRIIKPWGEPDTTDNLVRCIWTLLDLGCDPYAPNREGKRPVDYMCTFMRAKGDDGVLPDILDNAVGADLNRYFHIDEHGIHKLVGAEFLFQ